MPLKINLKATRQYFYIQSKWPQVENEMTDKSTINKKRPNK